MDPELLRTLYGGPPTGFVAARDAAVRELKAAGRRDEAAEVKRLRRHGPVEWALNRAAHLHPQQTAAFTTAAAALRGEQAAAVEGRGGDVRTATAELRDRLAALAAATASLEHAPAVPELSARLLTIAADERAALQLAAGVLGAEELAPPELFAGLEPGPARPQRARATPARASRATARPERATKEVPTAAPRPTARDRARIERAQRALRRADEAIVDARHDLDQAESRAAHARDELARAERRLTDAQATLARAQSDREAAVAALDELGTGSPA